MEKKHKTEERQKEDSHIQKECCRCRHSATGLRSVHVLQVGEARERLPVGVLASVVVVLLLFSP